MRFDGCAGNSTHSQVILLDDLQTTILVGGIVSDIRDKLGDVSDHSDFDSSLYLGHVEQSGMWFLWHDLNSAMDADAKYS